MNAYPLKLNVKPKQSLGQNFLIDDNIARNIVRDLDVHDDDILIEIGPGKGALTKYLAGKGRSLIAMEIDSRVVAELQAAYASPGVSIFHQDFLEASLPALKRQFKKKLRLVGNIPYHLTSSILFKAFDEHDAVSDITIMIQREVANRVVGKPSTKDYGILAVLSNFYGIPEILFKVSPNCFYPRPKVESAVIRIVFHSKKLYHVDEKLFTLVVKTTFGKRRKTIHNSLQYLPYDEKTLNAVVSLDNDLMEKRPEQLTTQQFVGLTQTIQKILAQ